MIQCLDWCSWNSSTELSMVLTAWFWAESLRLETLVFYTSHPNRGRDFTLKQKCRARAKKIILALKMCRTAWMLARLLVWTQPRCLLSSQISKCAERDSWGILSSSTKKNCACAISWSHKKKKGPMFMGIKYVVPVSVIWSLDSR